MCQLALPGHTLCRVVFVPWVDQRGEPAALEKITHSYKRCTAQQANRILPQEGAFWQHESNAQVVRDAGELARIMAYVADNPVRVGLVQRRDDGP